jgi:hypothetical protein
VDRTRRWYSNINNSLSRATEGGCLRHKEAGGGCLFNKVEGPFPAKRIDERRRRFHLFSFGNLSLVKPGFLQIDSIRLHIPAHHLQHYQQIRLIERRRLIQTRTKSKVRKKKSGHPTKHNHHRTLADRQKKNPPTNQQPPQISSPPCAANAASNTASSCTPTP